MKLEEYIERYNNSRQIYELKRWWTQCVAQVKHYSDLVLWVKLWTFWWSAYTGWLNKRNTFKKDIWRKVKNDLNNPNQVPPAGAIGFMKPTKYNKYWHTFTIIKAEKWKDYFEVFEQNVWSWNWVGYDDRAKKWKYRYNKNFLGWYEKIENNIQVEKIVEKADDLLLEINKNLQKENKKLKKINSDTIQILKRIILELEK